MDEDWGWHSWKLYEGTDRLYTKPGQKNENWNRICKNERNQYGPIQKTKSVESTRMVVYEFEMVERFLENSMYLDIPTKCLLLAQCHCLSMFALKIVLKNVQSIDVSSAYIESVILNEKGRHAMLLGTRAAFDLYSGKQTPYLSDDNNGRNQHQPPKKSTALF